MADILRITTPINDRNMISPNRPVTDPSVPFQLSDITKVIKPDAQTELTQQRNDFIERDTSATILMNLLKDPSVTVGYLKNIDSLQQIIKLLPVNNRSFTTEIEQLFNQLLISPEDIVSELLNQEAISSTFKGDLFDFLRQQLAQSGKPEMIFGITNLLKSLNALESREMILNSVANNLTFLANSLSASAKLSDKLFELAGKFREENAAENFISLKGETLSLLEEVKNSILYTPKLQKTVPMIIYNLSRFNDNPSYLKEATGSLFTVLDGNENRQMLSELLTKYVQESGEGKNSKVMDIIAQIIGKESENADINTLGGEHIEKIIYSLLSSPCNYTPLLHYIVPVQFEDMKSFAEIWIDPNAESTDNKGRTVNDCIHILMVFDIEGIGRFEAELAASGKDLMAKVFCPTAYVAAFSGLGKAVREQIASTGYRLLDLSVDKLNKQRSLMEVFKTLPHRRTGVDVTI